MSEYTTFEYESVRGTSDAGSNLIGSLRSMFDRIERAADELAVNEPDRMVSKLDAINLEPVMAEQVVRVAAERGLVESEASSLSALSTVTSSELGSLTRQARKQLIQAQAASLNGHFRCALEEMGYQIAKPRRAGRGLVSIRGHHLDGTSIVVEIEPEQERVEVDMSGFKPGVCQQATRTFVGKMKRRGVMLRIKGRQRHDSVNGGPLVQKIDQKTGDESRSAVRRQNVVRRPQQL